MLCTKCGSYSEDDARFCFRCGNPLTAAVEIEEDLHLPQNADVMQEVAQLQDNTVPASEPIVPPVQASITAPASPSVTVPSTPAPKGRLIVPAIILSVLSVIGLVLYFLFPMNTAGSMNWDETYNADFSLELPQFTMILGECYYNHAFQTPPEELTVPAVVDGQTVLSLGAGCFADVTEITTVILPDSLRYIREQAFRGCTNLRGIYIPEGVMLIGDGAFKDCSNLESVSLPASLDQVEDNAFEGCSKLKYVFFAGTVDQWRALYQGKSGLKATVTCSDGSCTME